MKMILGADPHGLFGAPRLNRHTVDLSPLGKIYVVPYGPNISLARAKLLKGKIQNARGNVVDKASQAQIIVVDPDLQSEALLREHVNNPRYANTCKVNLSWLEAALNGDMKDPKAELQAPRFQYLPNASVNKSVNSTWHESSDDSAANREQRAHVSPNAPPALSVESRSVSREDLDKVEDNRTPLEMNDVLVKELSKMGKICDAHGDEYRAKSYGQAAAVIRVLPFSVQRGEDLQGYKGIGKNMVAHINEILETGKYSKRESLERDPRTMALLEFVKVHGIGESIASRLYNLGFRSVSQLKQALLDKDPKLGFLGRVQKHGIELYEELEIRLSREEVVRMKESVEAAGRVAFPQHVSQDLIIEPCGSFRRGEKDCGDADLLMTCSASEERRVPIRPLLRVLMDPHSAINNSSVRILVTHSLMNDGMEDFSNISDREYYDIRRGKRERLEQNGALITSLDPEKPLENETFLGVCRFVNPVTRLPEGPHHRLDIISYSHECWAFGVMSWTGPTLFSREIRLVANSKGYSLTDRGLFPWVPSMDSRDVLSRQNCVRCSSEKEIFAALGLVYYEPNERNFGKVVELIDDDEDESHSKRIKSLAPSPNQTGATIKIKPEDDARYERMIMGEWSNQPKQA